MKKILAKKKKELQYRSDIVIKRKKDIASLKHKLKNLS